MRVLGWPSGGEATIRAAREVLARGGIVCLPTETYYGLAVRVDDALAVARVAECKGRDEKVPIATMAADVAQAEALWADPPPLARRLAARYWPGPLTIVATARAGLSAPLCGPAGVGVRVPAHELPRALAAGLAAISATSANASGSPPARCVTEAQSQLGAGVDLYIDGGEAPGGAPSTVVAIDAAGGLRLLRAGAITIDQEFLWPR